MIYGSVHSAFFSQQAAVLPRPLANALRYLRDADLDSMKAGQTSLELDGVPMIMQVHDVKTKPRPELYPEIHRKYIDLQFFVSGDGEKSTYYPDDGSQAVHLDLLDTERDILFYENNPAAAENCVYMKPGSYAIFFPWDVHIPGQSPDEDMHAFRKIVMKVPVDSCT